jgi:hypothetical protein
MGRRAVIILYWAIGQATLEKGQFLGALLTLPRAAEDPLDDHAGLRVEPAEIVRTAAEVATASIPKNT